MNLICNQITSLTVVYQPVMETFREEFKSARHLLFMLCVSQINNSFSGSVGVVSQMSNRLKDEQKFLLATSSTSFVLSFLLRPLNTIIHTLISIIFCNLNPRNAFLFKNKMRNISLHYTLPFIYFIFLNYNKL